MPGDSPPPLALCHLRVTKRTMDAGVETDDAAFFISYDRYRRWMIFFCIFVCNNLLCPMCKRSFYYFFAVFFFQFVVYTYVLPSVPCVPSAASNLPLDSPQHSNPKAWTIARVTLIPKEGSLDRRPLSLCQFCYRLWARRHASCRARARPTQRTCGRSDRT
mgnify:CR=1 FL=1